MNTTVGVQFSNNKWELKFVKNQINDTPSCSMHFDIPSATPSMIPSILSSSNPSKTSEEYLLNNTNCLNISLYNSCGGDWFGALLFLENPEYLISSFDFQTASDITVCPSISGIYSLSVKFPDGIQPNVDLFNLQEVCYLYLYSYFTNL